MNPISAYQPSPLALWKNASLAQLDRFITFGYRLLKPSNAHLRLDEPLFYPHAPADEAADASLAVGATQYLQQLGRPGVTDRPGLRAALLGLEHEREARLIALDAQTPVIDYWLGAAEVRVIQATCVDYLENEHHDLLNLLADEVLENYSKVQIARMPATLMAYVTARALDGPFVQQLLTRLGWYAGGSAEPPSPSVVSRLLRKAVALQLDPQANLAGFNLYAPKFRGTGYGPILQALAAHWVSCGIVTDSSTATFALYCLRSHLPAEFRSPFLSPSLPFLSSTAWVEFAHAARLAEALAPQAVERLSHEALLALARQTAASEDPHARELYLTCLAEPALEWAKARGHEGMETPTAQSYTEAVNHYLTYEQALKDAGDRLSRPMPERMALVDRYLHSIFLNADDVCASTRLFGGFFNRSLRDLVATGALLQDPYAWKPVNYATFYPPTWPNQFEDIPAQFEAAFSRWAGRQTAAIRVLAKALLEELDAQNQAIIGRGAVRLYSVRQESLNIEAFNDSNHPEIIAMTGRAGVVITSDFQGQRYTYEWLPCAGWLGRRDDVQSLRIGGEVFSPGGGGDTGGFLGRYSATHRLATDLPLDWRAYSLGLPPRPEAHGPLILTQVAALEADHTNQAARLERLADLFADLFFAAGLPALRVSARGQAPSERPSKLLGLAKSLVPFWSAVENLEHWRKSGDYGSLKSGTYGLAFDTATLPTLPFKLAASTARLATSSFKGASKWALRYLGKAPGDARRPLNLLPAAGAGAGLPGRLAITADSHASALGRSLNVRAGLARQLLGKLPQTAGMLAQEADSTFKLATLMPDAEVALRDALEHEGRWHLVDATSQLPFGPSLPLAAGERVFLAPDVLPLALKYGRPAIELDHAGLAIQWYRQEDELILSLGGTAYKEGRLPNGEAVLLRQAEQAPASSLWPLPCRVPRSPGLHCVASDTFATRDYHGLEALSPDEEGPVSWFEHHKIQAREGKLVNNGRVHEIVNNELRVQGKRLRYTDYKPSLEARLLGGNKIFKRILVNEGLTTAVDDTREVSAVVVRHIPSDTLRLVTRVDKGIFYAGPLVEGEVQALEKLHLPRTPERAVDYTDSDHLANIYTGALDANMLIARQGEARMNQALALLSDDFVASQEQTLAPFFTERFELATTRKMAVLYNRYARQAVVAALRENATYIHTLGPLTPAAQLEAMAAELDRLFVQPGRFKPADLYEAGGLREALGGRNLAYLEVQLEKDGQTFKEVYFSLSGRKRTISPLPLANAVPPEWQVEGDVKISPEGVRYIDCQPRKVKYKSIVWLPDLNKRKTYMHYLDNPRTLDSERNILLYLTDHPIDHEAVRSAGLYTQRPACGSCLTGIDAFAHSFAPGTFTLYEGP